MITNYNNQKPEITYPCEWTIKIIGSDEKAMHDAADSIIKDRSYVISCSNTSRTGKYISLKIKLILLSDEEKQAYYTKFSKHKNIKFVL
jgi:uncharacterized protein